MNQEKKLSIIIPVYNAENFLMDCLNSLINQSYKDLEIILVDDGSSDNSKEIIKTYMEKDSRIVGYFRENSGVSSARNFGIKKSKGDYIAFVDADDWLDLNAYEETINQFNKTNCDVVLFSYIKEFNSTIRIPEILPFKTEELLDKSRIHNDLVLNLISYADETKESIMGAIWRCVFKSDLLKHNEILFDTEMHYAEDLIFCLNSFSKSNSISIINKPFYHYRFNTSSVTAQYKSDHFERQLFIYDKIKGIFKNNNDIALNDRMNIMMLRYIINGITHICNTSMSFKEKYESVKTILNNKKSEDLRKNYTIKSTKYKILKYNLPLTTFLLISYVNNKSKKRMTT
ncbi:glycosyltransferase family 2 protein [Clostridium sp. 'White wine YQ']|uniref:glycosyltransferase family 2 protein n=1 Tax=Clostridium sp. 'White wine YQ' TaxID=3027474 RepID=UPI002365BBAA|nr:glycosyltransferase family 2 protein [Clostridium sp. 'White wine YQ']MDD7793388.1 glycosyltransferase family 2 protein [Clostridium sp. 'White wine YQ']